MTDEATLPLTADDSALARSKPKLLSAIVRFGAVGALGTLVNLAVLYVLLDVLGLGFTRSSAIATEAAILSNYVGNELWTFHHRKLDWARLARFNLVALAGLAVTVVAATLLKEFLNPYVAQILGIGGGAALNFGLNFGWTWRH
jgi:dolichol-phosphate mannosyltransferase